MSKVRGCGVRHRGAIYVEVPTSRSGRPLEDFLVCSPVPVDAEAMRLEPRGVSLIERPSAEGVYDIYDWIGSTHYPNVADVLAEGRRLGFSRRVARTLDFARIGPDTRLILLHSRAHMRNAHELRRALLHEARERMGDGHTERGQVIRASCPKAVPGHTDIHDLGRRGAPLVTEMCQALYQDDVGGGELVLDPAVPWRTVERQIGETVYRARRRPDGFVPDYQVAIFAVLPIGHITVIRDPEGGTHIDALDRAKRAGIDVELEDE